MTDTNREIVAIILPEGYSLDWREKSEFINDNGYKGQGFPEDRKDEAQKPGDAKEGDTHQETGESAGDRTCPIQKQLYEQWKQDPYMALYNFGFTQPLAPMSDSLLFLRNISAALIRSLSRQADIEFLRERTTAGPADEFHNIIQTAPFMTGLEYLDSHWIDNIIEKLLEVFRKKIRDYNGSVAEYFTSMSPIVQTMGRVFFHLVENKNGDYPFAFMATYSSYARTGGKSKHLPLKNALIEYKDDRKKMLELLSTVSKAAAKSAFIDELLDSGEIFHPIGLASDEAYTFLKEVPLYEESGILCRIPNWWKSRSNSIRLTANIGAKQPSHIGFDAILDFDMELSLGDEELTIGELKKLLAETEGLAFLKGKWVEINHEKLKEILDAYEKADALSGGDGLTLFDALRLQLNPAEIPGLENKSQILEVTNGEWLKTVISRLIRPEGLDSVTTGEDFNATLRPYQEKGLAWLNYMKTLGLGACLADDMGLGKTIQVIALLNYITSRKKEKALLVIPASLIGNWVDEINRFAPSLKYCVMHPSENDGNADELLSSGEFELYITTYGMLSRYELPKKTRWDTVILDEAQAIKNPGTKQTKTVKQLKASFRIALTGTPVENRLSDLWSLFDFLNTGLLGTSKEFTDFTKGLKVDQTGYTRLRNVVAPFILRRLKTDKSIISDLPDKIEMKTYSTLTKKQATIYNSLVDDIKRVLEGGQEGIERKGIILASIMKFKQICNHPDQYLGQAFYSEDESGKFLRLREICETIKEKRERVLVFTQFREITEPLKDFLEGVFLHKGLVLHGETPVAKRRAIVEEFQKSSEYVPFLVLSIKAGGVGLNLTNANHVIHFDRWWNPAVENQATDRAFRIGQNKNVIVHKFITRGTIEEKIDQMIEDKVKLAKDIIPDTRESWITEMDNQQLMELFRLERQV